MRYTFRYTLLAGVLGLATAGYAGPTQRATVSDTVVPALKRSVVTGTLAAGQPLHLAIGLTPRFPDELQAFCDAVSDPTSPMFRQYMTPAQVGENFGASPGDVANVVSYLKSNGMKVTLVAQNRMAVLADCTAAQAEKAFGVTIKTYTGPDPEGKTISFFANPNAATVPAQIGAVVQAIGGLQSYSRPHRFTTLSPALARGLYNTAPSYANGIQGQGRKIGYSNWDGYKISNAAVFITQFGLPIPGGGSTSNIHVVSVHGSNGNTAGSGEGDLDLQMLLSAAPLADIYIYDDNVGDPLGVLTREANDNLCDGISESWGWQLSANYMTSCHNEHLAMTAQGMTYSCASGDAGTADVSTYYYPNMDPDVISIGGTDANVNTATGARITEVGWSGSGGGWSTNSWSYNVHPSWQVGNGVPTGNNHRLVPDVALHATSYYLVYQGGLYTVGGTSCASPYFISSLSTMEQRLGANGQTARLGRVAQLIYGENGNPSAWYDITSGSNGTLPDGSTSSAHAGWDMVTGWGAPDFDGWYGLLALKTVSGTVTLSNFGGTVAGTPVTVQLYQAGTATLVDTQTGTLDGSGNFSVRTQAPPGSYDVYVKASHWLRRKSASRALNVSGLSGLTFTLTNGDVNGDNAVTLGDFAALRNAYNSSPGSNNWNPNADLNGDGAVTLSDFAIFRANYNIQGD